MKKLGMIIAFVFMVQVASGQVVITESNYMDKFCEVVKAKQDLKGETFEFQDGKYLMPYMFEMEASNFTMKPANLWKARLVLMQTSKPKGHQDKSWGMDLNGDNITVQGFEITSEFFDRVDDKTKGLTNKLAWGLQTFGESCKVVNNLVHDMQIGIASWSPAKGFIAYGNVVFNVARYDEQSPRKHKTHGHYFYMQNRDDFKTQKVVSNNIGWGTSVVGIQAYSQSGKDAYFTFENNTVFNQRGLNKYDIHERPFIFGANHGGKANGNVIMEGASLFNYWYNSYTIGGRVKLESFNDNFFLGHAALSGLDIKEMKGNVFYDKGTNAMSFSEYKGLENLSAWVASKNMSGNEFYSGSGQVGVIPKSSRGGTAYTSKVSGKYFREKPKGRVWIRPNKYDDRLLYVTVFNPRELSSVPITVPKGNYEVFDVESPFKPVSTFNGSLFNAPMNLTKYEQPRGNAANKTFGHSSPETGAFILKRVEVAASEPTVVPSKPVTAPKDVKGTIEPEANKETLERLKRAEKELQELRKDVQDMQEIMTRIKQAIK